MTTNRTTVKLSEPGVEGSYVISERRADGSLVLQPADVEAAIEEFADRTLSEDEQRQMFERLDAIADAGSE